MEKKEQSVGQTDASANRLKEFPRRTLAFLKGVLLERFYVEYISGAVSVMHNASYTDDELEVIFGQGKGTTSSNRF